MKRNDIIIKKEYMRNLFPMIFSVLGGTINTFIDSVFVSRIVGDKGLAAVSMCLPIYLVMCVIGALIGGGASVSSSHYMGKEQTKHANDVYDTAWTMIVVAGIAFTLIGGALSIPIAKVLSQGGELYEYVLPYTFYTMMAALPNMLVYMVINYLQLEGKTKQINIHMAVMVVLDILFDFVLMVPLGLGMRGAALASLISCGVAVVYGLISLERGFSNYHLHFIALKKDNLLEIVKKGLPIAMGNGCDTIKVLIVNALLLAIFGHRTITVLAILNAMTELSICITTGVTAAAGPMIGVFYSARENDNIRGLIKMQLQTGLVLTAVFAFILTAFNNVIANIYKCDINLFIPLLCLSLSCIFDIFASTYCNYINKTERLLFANILTCVRRLFSTILVLGVLLLIGISEELVWIYLPVSVLLTNVFIVVVARIVHKHTRKNQGYISRLLLLDDSLTILNKVLDFSIVPTEENICEAASQISEFCEENDMSPKTTMQIGMAIEEILMVIAAKNDKLDSVDLRIYALAGNTGLRIRCGGIRYNPFEADEDDDFLMGVNIMKKISDVVLYRYVLGLNNITILMNE